MYSPTLGKFLTRDPLAQNGEPDILYGDIWFANRLRMIRNLYNYVDNSPVNLVDPSGLDTAPSKPKAEEFYVCRRLVEIGGIAEKCGCQHTAIYGDQSGEVYDGWFGPVKPKNDGLPKGKHWKCIKLFMIDFIVVGFTTVPKLIDWGPKAGKSCTDATSADVLACLQAKPKPPGKPGILKNCQTDVRDAMEGCCLAGFTPLTITPPNPLDL